MLKQLNRLTPLFMAAFGLMAMVQLLALLAGFLGYIRLGGWLAAHSQAIACVFGLIAALAAMIAALAYLRSRNALPKALTRWSLLMDILDRLTNRAELEQRLRPKVEATYIDGPALAEKLKGHGSRLFPTASWSIPAIPSK